MDVEKDISASILSPYPRPQSYTVVPKGREVVGKGRKQGKKKGIV
jgi:hypothetical protein